MAGQIHGSIFIFKLAPSQIKTLSPAIEFIGFGRSLSGLNSGVPEEVSCIPALLGGASTGTQARCGWQSFASERHHAPGHEPCTHTNQSKLPDRPAVYPSRVAAA